jgi:hypothetical protein
MTATTKEVLKFAAKVIITGFLYRFIAQMWRS